MKTYEDLNGATGREIFYRAERVRARDLFIRHQPRVLIGGIPFHLENLSMTGLAASMVRANNGGFEVGEKFPIVIEGDTGILFEGSGSLCRVDNRAFDSCVALKFNGTTLDISALLDRYNESLIRRELNGGLSQSLEEVPKEYRRLCADVIHLLRSYRCTLDRFANLTARADRPPDSERVDSLYHAAEERLLPEWRKLWREGNELTLPIMRSPATLRATKEFTEQVLTPELMGGPVWNRSYRKPLGYPGDFQIMNYVYEWQPRGATVYERLLHRLGLDVLECVATRMVMVQQEIAKIVAEGINSGRPAQVLSLGCGPAQEVVNYLGIRNIPRPVNINLVDQDHAALDYAYSRVFPQLVRLNNGSGVRCLEVSFVELIKASGAMIALPPQDLIYSVGLVDYLSEKRAKQLAAALYRKLAPGGRVVIGNAAEVPLGGRWSSEFICDWSMYYRSESDMIEIANAVPEARFEVKTDPTGRIYMLYLYRAA